MWYMDTLTNIIKNKIAPDLNSRLAEALPIELNMPMNSVRVPLQAGVGVAYDKGYGAFIVMATICDKNPDRWKIGKSMFSTREMATAHDKAAVIDYLFDEAKKQMLNALAEEEFEQVLKSSKGSGNE